MDKSLSSVLRNTFLVHSIFSLIFGAALYIVPGRTLLTLGWVPEWVQLPDSELSIPGLTFVDSVITRVVGAALLALAYTSYHAWRSSKWAEVEVLVRMEAVFCVFGLGAFVAGLFLMDRSMPLVGWLLAFILAVFGVLWLSALWPKKSN